MSTLAYCAFEMVGDISKKKRQKIHNYLLSNHVSKGIDTNGLGFVEIAIPHFGILNKILQTFINPNHQKSITMSISSTN